MSATISWASKSASERTERRLTVLLLRRALGRLSIATFELSMGDFPSALVLMGIVPLAALLFFACLLWSASQLLRIRKDGVKFAAPFAICVATLLALQYAPLQQIYLNQNFWRHRAERDNIVERVENGELFPN